MQDHATRSRDGEPASPMKADETPISAPCGVWPKSAKLADHDRVVQLAGMDSRSALLSSRPLLIPCYSDLTCNTRASPQ